MNFDPDEYIVEGTTVLNEDEPQVVYAELRGPGTTIEFEEEFDGRHNQHDRRFRIEEPLSGKNYYPIEVLAPQQMQHIRSTLAEHGWDYVERGDRNV